MNSIIDHLWPPAGQGRAASIYAILDAARHEAVYPALCEAGVPYCCLFRGPLSHEMARAAPYLVQLHPPDPFTRWVIGEGWGDSWGIFVASSAGMNDLRRHFRRFLLVKDETNKTLYFRYYDPRVLRVYLPTCREHEVQYVFGPVREYILEAEQRDALLSFSHTYGQLTRHTVVLGA